MKLSLYLFRPFNYIDNSNVYKLCGLLFVQAKLKATDVLINWYLNLQLLVENTTEAGVTSMLRSFNSVEINHILSFH